MEVSCWNNTTVHLLEINKYTQSTLSSLYRRKITTQQSIDRPQTLPSQNVEHRYCSAALLALLSIFSLLPLPSFLSLSSHSLSSILPLSFLQVDCEPVRISLQERIRSQL